MSMILLAACLAVNAFASDQIPDVDMHAMTKEVLTLQRFMFSEAEFTSPKNAAAIRDSFPVLEKHLARLRTKVFADQPALRMNATLLSDQITDADLAFQRGDKAYSRYVLVSSLQLCVACHTRTASADFALPESELKGASTLDRAGYLFATRQFEAGRALYEDFLAKAGKRQPPGLVRAASLALAVFYARVKADPKGGSDYFAKLAKDAKRSTTQRGDFGAWARAFGDWAKEKSVGDQAVSDTKSMEQARALLTQNSGKAGDEIRSLRASALLQTVLEMPGETSPLKAEGLLDLGKIYESLNFPLYFRFGDMYLKQCISDYQKSKAAQDCYEALDSAVKGRAGQSPGDSYADEAELAKWRKQAF